MLVSAKEMLSKAKAGKYAIGHFNINNLEWAKAILLTAQEMNSPVILGVSEDAGSYMCGFKAVSGMVEGMLEGLNITVPVALHLDHGSYEACLRCIESGFTSIMFDGSQYPIQETIKKTAVLVELCKNKDISIEVEITATTCDDDILHDSGKCSDPDDCKKISDLGISMLAAGIGNIDGRYPANWSGLNFDILQSIKDMTGNIPLVLHGGTGIPKDMLRKAITLGVAKINVNTECQLAFAAATRNYIESGRDLEGKGYDPRKLLLPGTEAIQATVKSKIELFGSADRA